VRELAGQPLHERIEELIAQFSVKDDNAFRRPLNDLPIKLNGFTQRSLVLLVLGDIA